MSCFSDVPHQAVLWSEVLDFFAPCQLHTFIDGTLGAGGHSALLLEAHPEIERLLGFDRDTTALEYATERLRSWAPVFRPVHANFAELGSVAATQELAGVDGILLDLGVSSMQLDRAERGFSFMREGPLDMRMDQHQGITAYDIVNTWTEQELMQLFWRWGEEPKARLAARLIVAARPMQTTLQLAAVLRPLERYMTKKNIHPATRVFQALRIAVNGELTAIETVLPQALSLLRPGGRLAVISFHSLEDRLVKECFRHAASDKADTRGLGGGLFIDKEPTVRVLTRKPVVAEANEVQTNPRARSAKLRVAEKL